MTVSEFITKLDDVAWGSVVLCLLVGVGLILSISTGFLQFRKFGHAMKNTVGKVFKKQTAGKGEVTPLQALTTALAATVGTGNIAGVTGAIVIGGPGAVFWMWLSALVGMCTKFAEVTLAVQRPGQGLRLAERALLPVRLPGGLRHRQCDPGPVHRLQHRFRH